MPRAPTRRRALTERRRPGAWLLLAIAWVIAVSGLLVQQAGFWREGRLDSDVFALLPGGADPRLAHADARLAEAGAQQVVLLLDAGDPEATQRAAEALLAHLAASAAPVLRPIAADDGEDLLSSLRPHRAALLTGEQRERLRSTPPEALAEEALGRLLAPGTGALPWTEDPLGLWLEGWQQRAGRTFPRDGLLWLAEGGRDAVVLRLQPARPGFRLDGRRPLEDALDGAERAADVAAGGTLHVLRGGVPLHAEAAAARANDEVTTIGLGSLAAVLLLAWLAFRSARPILLVALSLGIGVLCGLAATAAMFGQVHLLTLVFGASLVGVAEDYGIHYFASRQALPEVAPRRLLRQLAPALGLALATSALAYLALGITPMPGLRQMALFSAAGLAGAFLTVVLWFPWLDRGTPRASRFAAALAGTLARWPSWPPGARGGALAAGLALFIAGGLWRLEVRDDLRSLQSSPAALAGAEREIAHRLGTPSPAQYFLVEAPDPATLLEREEALTARLARAVAQGAITGWRAVSDLVPSAARQAENRALVQAAERTARGRVAALLGTAPQAPDYGTDVLRPDTALATPAGAAWRPLWLGAQTQGWSSLVLVEGLGPAGLPRLRGLARDLPGVAWIDRTAMYSALLGGYRARMAALLVAGYAAVALVLALRFGRRAWHALLPTALAATLTLALLGWLGVPLTLFGVLAQVLLLGVGVDYGIFLLEHDADPAAWLAICLGAASTWLAFGLLALSATPALAGFGLSLMLGLAGVWALTPCFRPRAPAAHTSPDRETAMP